MGTRREPTVLLRRAVPEFRNDERFGAQQRRRAPRRGAECLQGGALQCDVGALRRAHPHFRHTAGGNRLPRRGQERHVAAHQPRRALPAGDARRFRPISHLAQKQRPVGQRPPNGSFRSFAGGQQSGGGLLPHVEQQRPMDCFLLAPTGWQFHAPVHCLFRSRRAGAQGFLAAARRSGTQLAAHEELQCAGTREETRAGFRRRTATRHL